MKLTIGKPIGNTQIYIVDRYLQLVPIGVTGELCIAGDGVGAGYLNRPELTAEKFLDNPFGAGKLYKTGDLAYWREDGEIVFVGRNDYQVKIRGLRIELGEIEKAISAVDGISQSVVTVRKNAEGRQLICAFYTGSAMDAKEIRAEIGKKLPQYMLPHSFTHLAAFPLTPNGKVNRKLLPDVALDDCDTEYAAPITETEKTLCALVAKSLQMNRVGRNDDFFDLGGDSLLAISLLSEIESVFGKKLETAVILRHPVMRELASAIDTAEDGAEEIPVLHRKQYPLLPQQVGIYTAVITGAQPLAYNMPIKIALPNSVDLNRLKAAIFTLYDQHEELHYRFVQKADGIFAEYDEEAKLIIEDVSSPAAFVRPFDLQRAPLIHVGFSDRRLFIDLHHILADGTSVHLLLEELQLLYEGKQSQKSNITFGDYSYYLHSLIKGNQFSDAIRFYKTAFSGEWEPVCLPPKQNPGSGPQRHKLFLITVDQLKRSKQMARKLDVTDTAFLLAVYGILLANYSGQDDILTSVVLTNRTRVQTAQMIGMFVNNMPVFLHLLPDQTFGEYVMAVHETLLSMYQYQEMPFITVADTLGIANKAAVNTSFVYQASGPMGISLDGEAIIPQVISTHTAKYDLMMEVTPAQNEALLRMEFSDAMEPSMVERMAESYGLLLDTITEDTRLKDVNVVSGADRDRVLYEFNNTSMPYPKDKLVHELIEEQAAKTPEKAAVVACDRTLSYRELNETANRIAHSLTARGVGAGDIVAVILPRTSFLIPTLLAVLKTGAAYMPVDPDYPRERIEYLLSESRASFTVTEKELPALLDNDSCGNLNREVELTDYFCALHTSGSTGRPKLTVLTQKNLLNFLLANSSFWENVDTVITTTIVTFDIFMQDTLLSLCMGKKIVLASNEQIFNQAEFEKLFEGENNVMFFATPTKLTAYIKQSKTAAFLDSISTLIVGGEVFTDELYDLIMERTGAGATDISEQTEKTVDSMYNVNGPAETYIATDEAVPSDQQCTSSEEMLPLEQNGNVSLTSYPPSKKKNHPRRTLQHVRSRGDIPVGHKESFVSIMDTGQQK